MNKHLLVVLVASSLLGLTACAGRGPAQADAASAPSSPSESSYTSTPAPAPQDPRQTTGSAADDAFVTVARRHLSSDANFLSDDELVSKGHLVCPMLEENPEATALSFDFDDLGREDSALVAGVAISAWCPKFEGERTTG
ncbi:MAG: hypothetical protein DI613_10185 [Kocuria rhizophila]|nr:MAG: hypothetical protein DI613_10185 [Kocuria rhizophila]